MVKLLFRLGAFAALLVLTHAVPFEVKDREAATTCYDLYMISARGTSNKDPTFVGQMSAVASQVITALKKRGKTAAVVGVDYPASKPPQNRSVYKGSTTMTQDLVKYVDACNSTQKPAKVALLGYSQGAQVTLDVICGTTENDTALLQPLFPFKKTPPLNPKYLANVVAAVVMGDPTHVLGEPFVASNNPPKANGVYPGKKYSQCKPYDPRIVSYCDDGDAYCSPEHNPNGKMIHNTYLNRYLGNATQFVLDGFNNN